jgi:hypothetical protein
MYDGVIVALGAEALGAVVGGVIAACTNGGGLMIGGLMSIGGSTSIGGITSIGGLSIGGLIIDGGG